MNDEPQAVKDKRRQGYAVTKLGEYWFACKWDWQSPVEILDNGEWREFARQSKRAHAS